MDYVQLSNAVKECKGLILAVKSSAIPLEECLANPYTKAKAILKRKQKKKNKSKNDISHTTRSTYGNGLYFQSSVEYVVGTPEKRYNVRISPKGGSIQIQGLNSPIFENSEYHVDYVLKYISDSLNIIKPTKDNRRIIIINSKTSYLSPDKYIRLNILSRILNDISTGESRVTPPFKIIFVTPYTEVESYIMIKFITPIRKKDKYDDGRLTSVKIFSGKKINILGAAEISTSLLIYHFLDEIFSTFKDNIILKNEKIKESNSTDSFDWLMLL